MLCPICPIVPKVLADVTEDMLNAKEELLHWALDECWEILAGWVERREQQGRPMISQLRS